MTTNLYRPVTVLRKIIKRRCCAFLFSPIMDYSVIPPAIYWGTARIMTVTTATADWHWWSALSEFDHFQDRHELNEALIQVPCLFPSKQWDSRSFILTIVSLRRLIFPPKLSKIMYILNWSWCVWFHHFSRQVDNMYTLSQVTETQNKEFHNVTLSLLIPPSLWRFSRRQNFRGTNNCLTATTLTFSVVGNCQQQILELKERNENDMKWYICFYLNRHQECPIFCHTILVFHLLLTQNQIMQVSW